MNLLPMNNFSCNNCNRANQGKLNQNMPKNNTSFKGTLDSSVYKCIRTLKNNVMHNSKEPDIKPLKQLDETTQLLEDFAKQLHPDTKITVRRGLTDYAQDIVDNFDKHYPVHYTDGGAPIAIGRDKSESEFRDEALSLVFSAKNEKTGTVKELGDIDIGKYSWPLTPDRFKFRVQRIIEKCTPQNIDKELFQTRINEFQKKAKYCRSFISKYFLRKEAQKLDKIAQEFDSKPNSLEYLESWSNYYKEANK